MELTQGVENERVRKRIIVTGAYAVLILVFIGLLFLFSRPDPTCTDGKQNQNETGIDCGGSCGVCAPVQPALRDIEIQETALVYGGPDRYDILARLFNPNVEYGAERFDYTFTLKDEHETVLVEKHGSSFILPRESKYIFEIQLTSAVVPKKIVLAVKSPEWRRFESYQEKPVLRVYNPEYRQITAGSGFGEAKGLVVNESAFDFDRIQVKVILRDADNHAVALNATEMRTMVAAGRRDFRLVWPTAFPGDVFKMETEVEADVYRSDNFIRQYFPGVRF